MSQLNNRINLDRAVGAEDNASKEEATMRNASKKTPWFLRFARAMKLKGIAATAGLGALYGLLFAGLLVAPLLPHLAAQSSGTTSTNSTPQLQHGDQVQWKFRFWLANGGVSGIGQFGFGMP